MWNKTFLSVLLILFTFMFTTLRAFPVVLMSSVTIVVSVSLYLYFVGRNYSNEDSLKCK